MKHHALIAAALVLLAPPAVAGEGHDHDAETTVLGVTRWSDTLELFLEYPAPVAGHPEPFTVHLTRLADFRPVEGGSVTLAFRDAMGRTKRFFDNAPTEKGVFAPVVGLDAPGVYDLELVFRGTEGAGEFLVEGIEVPADHDGPREHAPPAGDDSGAITFLKQQQWRVPFATAPAVEREMKRSVWAVGEVLPSPAAFVDIVTPVAGMVQAGDAASLALPGEFVARGDVVARIVPPLQGDGWAASQLALAQAERNYERAKRLRASDAISDRDFEEAENEYLARRAGLQGLEGGGTDGVLELTAPIAGQVIDWQVQPGHRLEAGDKLMAIADASVVWLRVNVYEEDFRTLGTPVGAYVNSGGAGGGWTIAAKDMRLLSRGGGLDPRTRTVPVLLEIDNTAGRLTINESTPVELHASDGAMTTAVPRTAVFEDEGRSVVFVQTGGETFEPRTVTLGPRHGDWVAVLSGIEPGERIVTRGGYHVKLAATSAEIGHGHAH